MTEFGVPDFGNGPDFRSAPPRFRERQKVVKAEIAQVL